MSWAEIKKAVNSDLTKPLDTLIKEQIATRATANELAAARSDITTIKNQTVPGVSSCIKSIQRGVLAWGANNSSISVTVTQINPSKCTVTLYGNAGQVTYGIGSGTSGGNVYNPYVINLTSTQLTLGGYSKGGTTCSWQIVEFN